MNFKPPKDDNKYRWTKHVVRKMEYYALTPSRVLRVIRAPERTEDGIVEGTLAVMQTAGSKAHPWELWVMWKEPKTLAGQAKNKKLEDLLRSTQKLIITAWRYPGTSRVRERVPIPSEIIAELEAEGEL